jgi:hypothetical protein
MKPILLLLGMLCLNVPVQAQMPEFFSLKPKSSIDIELPNHWDLRFGQNGQGSIGYGASFFDWATIPENGIKREAIKNLLQQLLKNKKDSNDISVNIIEYPTNVYCYYIHEVDVVASLFMMGLRTAQPRADQRFTDLLHTVPPLDFFHTNNSPSMNSNNLAK